VVERGSGNCFFVATPPGSLGRREPPPPFLESPPRNARLLVDLFLWVSDRRRRNTAELAAWWEGLPVTTLRVLSQGDVPKPVNNGSREARYKIIRRFHVRPPSLRNPMGLEYAHAARPRFEEVRGTVPAMCFRCVGPRRGPCWVVGHHKSEPVFSPPSPKQHAALAAGGFCRDEILEGGRSGASRCAPPRRTAIPPGG